METIKCKCDKKLFKYNKHELLNYGFITVDFKDHITNFEPEVLTEVKCNNCNNISKYTIEYIKMFPTLVLKEDESP